MNEAVALEQSPDIDKLIGEARSNYIANNPKASLQWCQVCFLSITFYIPIIVTEVFCVFSHNLAKDRC